MSGFDSGAMGLFGPNSMGGLLGVPGYGPMGALSPLPGMNIPYGYLGPNSRPCGGYGGYDAAANEARRLQEDAWNSVTTNNIHKPHRFPNTSASLPNLPNKSIVNRSSNVDEFGINRNFLQYNLLRQVMEISLEQEKEETLREKVAETFREIVAAKIQHQRGPLTVYEQTGDSHISHVAGKGFHVTTQVPGIGKDVGLDKTLAFHTYVKLDRSGCLRFDSDY